MRVSEAADALQVNDRRVRQLIERGDLRAQRFGRQWMVRRDDVSNLRASTRVAGHPFSPANAWGVLALAEGRRPSWLSESERKRLAGILAERGIRALMPLLRRRAERETWFVHQSLLGRLMDDSRTVRTGASAAESLISADTLEVYVPSIVSSDVAAEYYADTASWDGNVLVRVIDGPWPFVPGEDSVGPVVAALDLLDQPGDDRRVRIAEELLSHA